MCFCGLGEVGGMMEVKIILFNLKGYKNGEFSSLLNNDEGNEIEHTNNNIHEKKKKKKSL